MIFCIEDWANKWVQDGSSVWVASGLILQIKSIPVVLVWGIEVTILLPIVLGLMSDNLAVDHVNNVLGDVRRMVGDTL